MQAGRWWHVWLTGGRRAPATACGRERGELFAVERKQAVLASPNWAEAVGEQGSGAVLRPRPAAGAPNHQRAPPAARHSARLQALAPPLPVPGAAAAAGPSGASAAARAAPSGRLGARRHAARGEASGEAGSGSARMARSEAYRASHTDCSSAAWRRRATGSCCASAARAALPAPPARLPGAGVTSGGARGNEGAPPKIYMSD